MGVFVRWDRENCIKSFSKVSTRRQCVSLVFGGKRGVIVQLSRMNDGCACPVASVAVARTYSCTSGVVVAVAFEYLTWR